MEEFLTRTAREVYEFLFDKGLPLELCDKIEEEEIDGPGFLDLTEEDIKQLTDKMGLIKKVQRVIREVKGQSHPVSPSPISSPPVVPSPNLSSPGTSDDGSSIASSASAMVRAKPGSKGFKIPDMWRPSIMSILNDYSDGDKAKKLSREIRCEIVRDLVTQMYACTDKPNKAFCSDVAKKLVSKYPFMQDKGEGVSGYGSWERKIVERVQNTRKKRPSEQPCGPPAKRGRPRIDPLLDRYPPYSSNAESEDEVHEQAMKDELDGAKRKDVIVPHLRASFASRRDFILSSEESNGYDDIVGHYPALKLPWALELEFDLIMQRRDCVNQAITDWRIKWVPAICSYATASTTKCVKTVLAQEKDATGADKDERLALKVLCSLLGKKDGLMCLYEEYKMVDDVEQVGSKAPLRPSPRFASFSTVGGTMDYFVFVNCKPLCKVATFARALMLWFVSHYVFHLEYAKEIKEIGYFFQETVFGSVAKAKKTATYLSVTTAIQSHAE